ncbi:flavoprotein [uncultured Streptomyces sp.]|uniref:flavoprotein n=1 Tax=uncultured Streptomyces sp. TaxID=174707 RepID=UPI0026378FBA|nr:flavoprotein [uncultured Streptomyces sp.]
MAVLYVFGSAAPPVLDVERVVEEAQSQGWDVCVGLTPTAARWLEPRLPALESLTGRPVRSTYKMPGEPDVWPPADVILVAPATFNTVNSWALGVTSTYVVGVAAEVLGKGIPLVTMPCANAAYVRHPQFERSLETLREAGVHVLYGPGGFVPDQPGESRPGGFPWAAALKTVETVVSPSP